MSEEEKGKVIALGKNRFLIKFRNEEEEDIKDLEQAITLIRKVLDRIEDKKKEKLYGLQSNSR
jgi:hypothetical protein